MLLFTCLLGSTPAAAWAEHHLLTDRALHTEWTAWVAEPVNVEPLEVFLEKKAPQVADLFAQYEVWLAQRPQPPRAPARFAAETPDVEAFLAAARLNPDTRFSLVERALPAIELPGAPVPASVVSPWIARDEPLFLPRFVDNTGGSVPIRSVLSTFSDEPDWGMDIELYGRPELGYGRQPYGRPWGRSSQAPFHSLYAHESPLVIKATPGLAQGRPAERLELYIRLARLALKEGHEYWGWRFAAWAIHYAQDLSQPYRAAALPGADRAAVSRYALRKQRDCFQACALQGVANHEQSWEDFVAFHLVQSFLVERPASEAIARALWDNKSVFPDDSALALTHRLAEVSSARAPVIDAAVAAAFVSLYPTDPSYDLSQDPRYHVPAAIEALPAEAADRLSLEAVTDTRTAGIATRTVLALVMRELFTEGASFQRPSMAAPEG